MYILLYTCTYFNFSILSLIYLSFLIYKIYLNNKAREKKENVTMP